MRKYETGCNNCDRFLIQSLHGRMPVSRRQTICATHCGGTPKTKSSQHSELESI